MDMLIETYRLKVVAAMERALASREAVSFDNSGPTHAKVVLDVLLANTTQSLDVVAGVMDKSIWDVSALRQLLERKNGIGKVRVLLDEISEDVVPADSALYGLTRHKNLSVKRLPTAFHSHFCVADRQHVRLEFDKAACAASISFGDAKDFGPTFEDMFGSLWSSVSDAPQIYSGSAA
jgi:hypothetical protein